MLRPDVIPLPAVELAKSCDVTSARRLLRNPPLPLVTEDCGAAVGDPAAFAPANVLDKSGVVAVGAVDAGSPVNGLVAVGDCIMGGLDCPPVCVPKRLVDAVFNISPP